MNMRLKVVFYSAEGELLVPYTYSDTLSRFVRKLLGDEGKRVFTFSPLRAVNREIKENGILLRNPISWYISSPIKNYIYKIEEEILRLPEVELFGERIYVDRTVKLDEKEFHDGKQSFKAMSPIVVRKIIRDKGQTKMIYYSPYETEFYNILKKDLVEKYKLLYGKEPQSLSFYLEFDKNYCSKRKKISKLIDTGSVKIKGWFAPFKLESTGELIKIAYEWGLGDLNYLGFGMIDTV